MSLVLALIPILGRMGVDLCHSHDDGDGTGL
jgi:hypothetical protein